MLDKIDSETQDRQMLRARQSGDSRATEYLLEKYSSLVKKKARKLYLIGGEQEDLIQEGMIGLFKAIVSFDMEQTQTYFSNFAELCVTRQIYTAITSSNRKKHRPLNEYISFYEPVNVQETKENMPLLADFILDEEIRTNPEQIVLDKEDRSMLESIIVERLSRFEKRVLKLYLEGKKYSEIAAELELTVKQIDNAIQRIRRKLTSVKK